MRRLHLLFFLFFTGFILIWLRVFYWQIIKGAKLASDAENQYNLQYSIFPKRGKILDKNSLPLAANEPAYLLYFEPKKITKNSKYLEELAKILQISEASIEAKINYSKSWIPIQHNVSDQQKKQVENLEITGIGFEKESVRFYPEGSSSAHLLGFVGSDLRGQPKGYFGIEGYYDAFLKGKPGFVEQEKDALGFPIPIGKQSRIEAVEGIDIILNIDLSIQKIVEERLKKGVERYDAQSGAVLVANPQNGKILAMAAYPGYDQAKYKEYSSNLYKNPLIADAYEPGSTFKIFVMAAAIAENKVKPESKYDETGPVEIGQYSIRTWDNKYKGKITMTQILEKSSNVGMVYVANKVGKDKLYEYLKNFGFGQKTGIDLQEEVSSKLKEKNKWGDIDLATISFGQGIAVTPIQLVRAAGAIANKGKLVTPRVADYIIEQPPPAVIIPSSVSTIITQMMVSAVDNGDAKWAKPKGFRIAGKTGTAQIPVKGHYDEEKTIVSFIGFAPVDNPEFIMLVLLREPKTSPWGSETAAPLFFDISRDLFVYLDISPQ